MATPQLGNSASTVVSGGGPVPFFGLALIAIALTGAYLWVSGKWDAVWKVLSGNAGGTGGGGSSSPSSSTTTNPPALSGMSQQQLLTATVNAANVPVYVNIPVPKILQDPAPASAAVGVGQASQAPNVNLDVSPGSLQTQYAGIGGIG